MRRLFGPANTEHPFTGTGAAALDFPERKGQWANTKPGKVKMHYGSIDVLDALHYPALFPIQNATPSL